MAGKTYYTTPYNAGHFYDTLYTLESGESVAPIILVNGATPSSKAIRDRWRPTGEVGSGPYFNAYKAPESGVLSYLRTTSGSLYTTNADYECLGLNGYGHPRYTRRWVNQNEIFSFTWLGKGGYNYMVSAHYMRLVYVPPDWTPGVWNFYQVVVNSWTGKAYDVDQALAFCDSFYEESRNRLPQDMRSCYNVGTYTWIDNMVGYSSFDYKLKERINFEENIYLQDTLIGAYRSCADNAYINAAENLPEATTNSIMNVLEIAATFASFTKGYTGIGSLKDAWLGYRYQYGTTTLDITEYADLTFRLCELAKMPRFTVYGSASRYGITANVQFDIDVSDFIPYDAKSWLKAYGFKLSAVNVWDMIPYSFVVDWFLHVGDILQKFEDYQQMYHLKVSNAWVTFTTVYDGQKTYQRLPYRFQGSLPWMTFGGASTKTIGKRVLDTVALFLVK